MATSLPGRVQIAPDVLFQQVADESVLLDLKSDRYFGLDDVGTRMWQLLMEHGDPGAVCAQVAAEYGSGEVSVRHDLGELLAKLVEAGLVTVTPTAAESPSVEQAE